MTRKDYEAIARIIKSARTASTADDAAEAIAQQFAVHAKGDNARFDRERFIAATR